jgi:hypothetical protein
VNSGSYGLDEINNLVFDIGAGEVSLINGGSSDDIHVENDDSKGKLSVEVKGDTMYIKTRGKRLGHTGGEATITLPVDIMFDSVQIDMSAGDLDIETLNTTQLYVDVTAGDLECKEPLTVDSSTWEISAGEISVDSLDCQDTRLKCTAGTMDFCMVGDASQYKLEGKVTAGKLNYDNDDFDWGNLEHGSDDAPGKIDVKCTAGTLDIEFEN